jgi:hypothetical protein
MEASVKKPTPKTPLLAHLALLDWYRDVIERQEKGVIICVLMLRVPGEFTSARVHCDILKTRIQYLKAKPGCFRSMHCLPRKRLPRESSDEANVFHKGSLP